MITVRTILITALVLLGLGIAMHVVAVVGFDRLAKQSVLELQAAEPNDSEPPEAPLTIPSTIESFAERVGVKPNRVPQWVRLRQSAEMRMAPNKPWQPLDAQQVISIHRPGFVWYAEQSRARFVALRVIDAYVGGHGFLKARLLGSIPVANLDGPEADQSELTRYLAELPWAPDAMLHNPALRWRELDRQTIEVSADSNGGVAAVRLYFDDAGDIFEIQADERGSTENGQVIQRPWVGRFSAYGLLGGRRIPTKAEVGYVYDDGYAAYWRGEITEYELQGD